MADINQVITLGIGTPGGIEEFLTLGLQAEVAAHSVAPASRTYVVESETRIYYVYEDPADDK